MQQRIEFRTNELKMSTELNVQYIQWLNVYFYCWTLGLGDLPCHTWSMRTFNIQPNLLFISRRKRGYPNHNNHFKENQSEWRREQIYYWLFISSSFSTLYISIHTYNNHCRASGIKKYPKSKGWWLSQSQSETMILFSLYIFPITPERYILTSLVGCRRFHIMIMMIEQFSFLQIKALYCIHYTHIRFILHDRHLLIHDVT